MRIISGSKARMTILPPEGMTTRPVTDRVKENIFNILQFKIAGTRVADLFCGTGSMGLETLSRGASHAIFADQDRDALDRLRQNIAKLKFESQSTVVQGDIFARGISARTSAGGTEGGVNLVFVDPPYKLSAKTDLESPLGRLLILLAGQTAPRAIVVVRHERRVELLPRYESLHLQDRREYGTMAITFLENVT